MKPLRYLVIATSLLIMGCSGSSNQGIAAGLSLPTGTNALLSAYSATPSSPAALTFEGGQGTIDLTTVLVGIREVKLKTAEMSDLEATDYQLTGPFVIDLANDTVVNCGTSNSDDPILDETPIFDVLTLPAGTYVELKARLDDVTLVDCPDLVGNPLIGSSLYMEGTVNGTPFTFREEFDTDFVVSDPNGIPVDDTSITSFILTFNVANWFDGVDFSGADKNGDGVIVIDSVSNQDLQDLIKQNVEDTAELENDADIDGIPDSVDSL